MRLDNKSTHHAYMNFSETKLAENDRNGNEIRAYINIYYDFFFLVCIPTEKGNRRRSEKIMTPFR